MCRILVTLLCWVERAHQFLEWLKAVLIVLLPDLPEETIDAEEGMPEECGMGEDIALYLGSPTGMTVCEFNGEVLIFNAPITTQDFLNLWRSLHANGVQVIRTLDGVTGDRKMACLKNGVLYFYRGEFNPDQSVR